MSHNDPFQCEAWEIGRVKQHQSTSYLCFQTRLGCLMNRIRSACTHQGDNFSAPDLRLSDSALPASAWDARCAWMADIRLAMRASPRCCCAL